LRNKLVKRQAVPHSGAAFFTRGKFLPEPVLQQSLVEKKSGDHENTNARIIRHGRARHSERAAACQQANGAQTTDAPNP
jgi:hypothetical protein